MYIKRNDEASCPSRDLPTKHEVSPSPPCYDDDNKPCLEKEIDGWEVLSKHSLTQDGGVDEDKNSDLSPSLIGAFGDSRYSPRNWDRSPSYPKRYRPRYDLEYSATWMDRSKFQGQTPQPTFKASAANRANDSRNIPVDSNSNTNPDSKPDTGKYVTLSLEEVDSHFWVSHVAERRELFARIEKLEKKVEAQAVISKRIDDLQEQIDKVQAAQNLKPRDKKKIQDQLQVLEEELFSLTEDIDRVEMDYASLQTSFVDLTDDVSALEAVVDKVAETLEQRNAEHYEEFDEVDDTKDVDFGVQPNKVDDFAERREVVPSSTKTAPLILREVWAKRSAPYNNGAFDTSTGDKLSG
ncbi:hypothetical protein F5Y06DRAFT_120671 [Hypoxylon sp. FL0890]|nr:hypothetical protein F5Y06DRAFT_120671 [Hypoxylon sp. FL0890]